MRSIIFQIFTVFLISIPSLVHAQSDCSASFDLSKVLPVSVNSMPCTLVESIEVNGKTHQIFQPAGAWPQPELHASALSLTKEALLASLATYEPFMKALYNDLNMPELAIVITGQEHLVPGAWARADIQPDDSNLCVIGVGMRGIRLLSAESNSDRQHAQGIAEPQASFKQVIAHEIFHCVQYKVLARRGVPINLNTYPWWFEGTATYFSNVVYPDADLEHIYDKGYEPLNSLIQQQYSYSDAHFFQYAANELGGAQNLFLVMNNFNLQQDLSSHILNILNTPGFVDIIHRYGVNLQMNRGLVQDQGKRRFAFRPKKTLPVQSEHQLPLESHKWTVNLVPNISQAVLLKLPPNSKFKVAAKLTSAQGHVRVSMGSTASDMQEGLSHEFTTQCASGESTASLIASYFHFQSEPNQLEISVEYSDNPCPCNTANSKIDSCLVGRWQVDPLSIAEYLLGASLGSVNIDSITGNFKLSILQNKAISVDAKHLEVKASLNSLGMGLNMDITNTVEANIKGQLACVENSKLMLWKTRGAASIRSQISGISTLDETTAIPVGNDISIFQYQCDREELILGLADSLKSVRFTRVAP